MPVSPGSPNPCRWNHGCCLYLLCAPLEPEQAARTGFVPSIQSINWNQRPNSGHEFLMDSKEAAIRFAKTEHSQWRRMFEALSTFSPLRHKRMSLARA